MTAEIKSLLVKIRTQTRTDRRLLRSLALLWVPALAAIVVTGVQDFEDAALMMRDPAATAKMPRYLGIFSNLGVVAWTVSAVIFLGTAYVMRASAAPTRIVVFCASAGVFSSVLGLDDLFMLHEQLGGAGVPQSFIFGLYSLLAAAWVLSFQAEFSETPVAILVAATVMFGISLGIDILLERNDTPWRIVTEDGAKFLGILALSVYAAGTARRLLSRSPIQLPTL